MKLKRKNPHSDKTDKTDTGEEFFRVPRAESLLSASEEPHVTDIGALATNPVVPMAGRQTLPVTDDKMQGADIRPGDYVVVQQQSGYPEGAILAVQLGDQQLIRRYFFRGGRIHLECDPTTNQIIIVEPHTPDFRILGQVTQIIREIK